MELLVNGYDTPFIVSSPPEIKASEFPLLLACVILAYDALGALALHAIIVVGR